ncbi:MAG TPA: EF-hand domain-containing protein [Chthoniobacteraceae bacterium]|jgi:hypothetical protein|nr:EF-hand domain-containing protein [Chthoniobacteraceae bacterium]
MYRHLLLAAAFAATASAQQSSSSAHRSPEQVFQFLDKDKNGTLSQAGFGVLKDKMPSLRDRPDGVAALFKRLDKDGNGSLSLDEYRALANHGARGSGTPSTPATTAEPAASDPSAAKHSKKRGARMTR